MKPSHAITQAEQFFQDGLIAAKEQKLTQAEMLIVKAIECDDSNSHYYQILCDILRCLRQCEKAISAGKQAITLAPKDADAFYLLALAYSESGAREAAIQHYQKTLHLNPRHDKAANNLGAILEAEGKLHEAEISYAHAAELNPGNAEAHNNLGAILSARGDLEHARKCFAASIDANPFFIHAHHNLSTFKTYTASDPHLIAMEKLAAEAHSLPPQMQVRLWFALGKAWEDTKRYDDSFAAYARGNLIYRRSIDYNEQGAARNIEDIIQRFDKPLTDKKIANSKDRTPIFIIGMPRSGTTLIEQILSSHSHVFGAGELPYLCDVLAKEWGLASGISYIDRLESASGNELAAIGEAYLHKIRSLNATAPHITDKMPGNYFYIGLIYKVFPEAKIIHCVRDPMDTCFSNYSRLFKETMNFAYDLQELGRYWRRYDALMRHWKNVLPKDVILAVHYEEVVADLEGQARRLLQHCGLPWEDACLAFHQNKRLVETASVAQVRRPIYQSSIARWEHYRKHLEPLRVALEGKNAPAQDAQALHLLGLNAYQAGNADAAIALIQHAIHADEKNALFHANLTEIYRVRGQLAEAIAHGKKAVALDPHMVAAHTNLGIGYFDQKEYEKAEACQKVALEIDPNFAPSLNSMASILRARGNDEGAAEYYRKAIRANPQYADPFSNLGEVLLRGDHVREALAHLNHAVALNPNHAQAWCNRGYALLALSQQEEAHRSFLRALQLRPDYAEAYAGLARLFNERNRLTEAETWALKSIELAPVMAECRSILASIYQAQGRADESLEIFETALKLDPKLASAQLGIGSIMMEKGEMEMAESLFRNVLASGHERIQALCSLSQVRKIKPEDDLIPLLEKEAGDIADLSDAKASRIHFALGKAYDDNDNPEKAFPHFLEGCRLHRKHLNYRPDEKYASFARQKELFSKSFIEQNRGQGFSSDTPIFIVGMPRSGTTLTEQIIASHPEVFGAGELPYFPEIVQGKQTIETRGQHYVERLRALAPGARRIIDKMPENYFHLGMIHLALPNARIIHIERNPLDTCLSCFTHLFSHPQEYTYDLYELGRFYREYSLLMDHWRTVLPKGSFCTIRYEELVDDVDTQARRMIDYCGLEWNDACLAPHKTKRNIRTASITQVRKPIYQSSVARWKKYEQFLGPLEAGLKGSVYF